MNNVYPLPVQRFPIPSTTRLLFFSHRIHCSAEIYSTTKAPHFFRRLKSQALIITSRRNFLPSMAQTNEDCSIFSVFTQVCSVRIGFPVIFNNFPFICHVRALQNKCFFPRKVLSLCATLSEKMHGRWDSCNRAATSIPSVRHSECSSHRAVVVRGFLRFS